MYCKTITSPNYPFNYRNRVDKDLKIEVALGQRIEIVFTEFDIENHQSCSWDWVQVVDGDGTELLPKTCGRNKPNSVIKSRTNQVYVKFHTDGSVTRKGFSAEWNNRRGRICDISRNVSIKKIT